MIETAKLFHERFHEILTMPLEVYIRVLLVKKVNCLGHQGASFALGPLRASTTYLTNLCHLAALEMSEMKDPMSIS